MNKDTERAVLLISALIEEMLDGDKVKLLTGNWCYDSDGRELTALGLDAHNAVETIREHMAAQERARQFMEYLGKGGRA